MRISCWVATVSVTMAVVVVLGAVAGQALNLDFADKAAADDGEMFDVISNMSLVGSFCGPGRGRHCFDRTIAREMAARQSNLERLRILRGTVTINSLLLGFAMPMHGRP